MTDALIRRFLARPAPDEFDALALKLLRSQAGDPAKLEALTSWKDSKPVPAQALVTAGTSTTTAEAETVAAVRQGEWRLLLPQRDTPLLLLETSRKHGSTATADAVSDEWPSETAIPYRGGKLDRLALRSWLATRQRARIPVALSADGIEAEQMLTELYRRRLRFRLPAGSRLICRCSYSELAHLAPLLATRLPTALGIAPLDVVYQVDEPTLTSRIPVVGGGRGGLRLGDSPPWIRYHFDSKDARRLRMVVFDLATTRLPACQELDWEIALDGGLVLHVGTIG